MRLALIGPTHPFRGGIAQYTAGLCSALEREGHDVLVISFKRLYPSLLFPGRSQTDSSACPIQVPHEALLDSIRPRSWTVASQELARYRPDALVVQWWHPFFGPAYAGVISRLRRRMSVPAVFLCHNVFPHERPPIPGIGRLMAWSVARTFRHVDGFLAHSEELVNQIGQLREGTVARRIFHPAYDFYPRSNRGRTEGDRPRLLFFGNIRRYKGLDVFLRALGIVKQEMLFRATVAGEFYTDAKVSKALADRLGLDDCLVWRDHYIPNEEVPTIFEAADLVVLPYLEATQSGVVPLAYRFGVPVIASNVGGLSEVVQDGRTGYLVPSGNPEALARRIVQYFRERKRDEFEANIEHFRDQLNWSQVVKTLIEVVEAIRVPERLGDTGWAESARS
jgi:D-inositol-3-phosphate glycosyltransferase